MQMHQLRYLIAAAEQGSFRAAAHSLYVSQSSISTAIKDLEQELGVAVFARTSQGATLTAEGLEIVERARTIVEQVRAMEGLYARHAEETDSARFAVSSQHYSLVVDAFCDLVEEHGGLRCALSLRESYTNEIIRDVQDGNSDLGIIYLSNYNDRAINRALSGAGLVFASLYVAQPHAIVRPEHPLAERKTIAPADLEPYPRLQQEQGIEGSSYFAEEPLAMMRADQVLTVSDNGTLSTLLARTDAYALGTGAFIGEGFVSIPIDVDETMNVGVIRREGISDKQIAKRFLTLLAKRVLALGDVVEVSPYTRSLAS